MKNIALLIYAFNRIDCHLKIISPIVFLLLNIRVKKKMFYYSVVEKYESKNVKKIYTLLFFEIMSVD